MIRLFFLLGILLITITSSCNAQKEYNLSNSSSSNELIFTTTKWKNNLMDKLNEYLDMNISDSEKTKINLSQNYISYFDDNFLERTFKELEFSNHFQSDSEYYFMALFVEGEVFYNQIYVLKKSLKCEDYLYTQAGKVIEFNKKNKVSCTSKQNQLTNLFSSKQDLNTGVRNNMIIIWHVDSNRNEDFKVFYNPNYLQMEVADNFIYTK